LKEQLLVAEHKLNEVKNQVARLEQIYQQQHDELDL
jgi:hypothetical protein